MLLSCDGRSRIRIYLYLGLFLLISTQRTASQDTDSPQQPTAPTCTDDWTLLGPSGQTPCETLVDVMDRCPGSKDDYLLESVRSQPLLLYPGPSGGNTTCECNTVVYNLFQACAACQLGANATLSNRTQWFTDCPSPSTIPIQPPNYNETTLWITQVYKPMFNVSEALQVEQTGQPLPNSTDSSDGNGNATPTMVPQSAEISKQSNTPIIVGVVVGVVVLLAIVGILFFLFTRRKRSRTAPSKEFMQYAPVNQAITQSHEEESTSIQQNVQGSNASRNNSGVTEEMESLPTFTPGLFKDPIFEKGAALNIASNAGYSGATGSPLTYSPATPSTTQNTSEQQRLIQSRQASGS